MEMIAVLAVLLIMAALVVPTLKGMRGNSYQKAAADVVRARVADAHSLGMSECVAYRVAVHQDGIRIRFAPDGVDFADLPSTNIPGTGSKVVECKLEKATVVLVPYDANSPTPSADAAGWMTVATFQPDGTSLEDKALLEVHEAGFPPIRIALRGVTGGTSILPPHPQGGSNP